MRHDAHARFEVRTLSGPVDLTALHAAWPTRYPHLLQSVTAGAPQARYDILFAFPGARLSLANARQLTLDDRPCTETAFLAKLQALWQQHRRPPPADAPLPFTGGWFVFLGYELIGEIEPRLSHIPQPSMLPLAMATRFPAAVIRDHAQQQTLLVGESDTAEGLLQLIEADIANLGPVSTEPLPVSQCDEEAPARYLQQVARAKEYIAAGDVFQVNLSRTWNVRLANAVAPVQVYRRLRQANAAPFACLVTWPDGRAIISSSPERLVEVRAGRVRTRPIAGTYPRSDDARLDAAWSRELLAHPKERAEHIMLVDLERNDLGRVCRPGSVRVPELMTVESYRHVHHIVSEVVGELTPTATPIDVIRAVFPGGTITGCPKIRCMEIIAELEASARGAYTGSVGYMNHDGSMDFNILIRTLVQQADRLSLRAGAGVVADSDPRRELAETRAKAKGLLAVFDRR